MGQITIQEVDRHRYNLYYVGAYKRLIGKAIQDIDGFFYYWPDKGLSGSWGGQTLIEIAQVLNQLNQEYEEQIRNGLS